MVGLGLLELRPGLQKLRVGLDELTFGARQIAFGLIERRLERPRINLKEQLPFPDKGTLDVVLLHQVTRDLGFDVGVDHPVQGADPFAVDRNGSRFDPGDLDDRRVAGRGRGSRRRASFRRKKYGTQKDARRHESGWVKPAGISGACCVPTPRLVNHSQRVAHLLSRLR